VSEDLIPSPSAPTSLSWMPVFVADLLAQAATMTAEQLGGLFRLRGHAWSQRPECALPNDPARLAAISGLGERWEAQSGAIMERLTVHPDDPTKLVEPWLLDRHREQVAKYISAATRGGKGGRPRKGEPRTGKQMEKLSESSAFSTVASVLPEKSSAKPELNLSESSASSELSFSLSSDLKSTSLNQSTDKTEADGKLSFPVRRPADDPYRAADAAVNSESARRDAAARALGERYENELATEVERFRIDHPAEYEAARIESIKALGLFGRELTDRQQAVVDGATTERIRREQGWVGKAAYMANDGKPAPTWSTRVRAMA
jgi:hypothetical protein